MKVFIPFFLAALLVSLAPGRAGAGEETTPPLGYFFLQAGGHLSFLSDASDRSMLGNTFGYSVSGGYRRGGWGIFARAEHNLWMTVELNRSVTMGAFNLALGAERLYFGDRVRTSLAAGPSILLFDTKLDQPGETGLYLDIRPLGVRWPLGDRFVLILDPLSAALVAPVLGKIPLVMVEYRTTLLVELHL